MKHASAVCWKTAHKQDVPTSRLHCGFGVLGLICGAPWHPNMVDYGIYRVHFWSCLTKLKFTLTIYRHRDFQRPYSWKSCHHTGRAPWGCPQGAVSLRSHTAGLLVVPGMFKSRMGGRALNFQVPLLRKKLAAWIQETDPICTFKIRPFWQSLKLGLDQVTQLYLNPWKWWRLSQSSSSGTSTCIL